MNFDRTPELAEHPGRQREALLPTETPLIERLRLNAPGAWRELDSIPVPQTTFYDINGLPGLTVLGDGTRVYPQRSTVGKREVVEDPSEVGADLRPRKVEIEVVWSGAVPDEYRSEVMRSPAAEAWIAAGYDEAANSIHAPGAQGIPGRRRKLAA